MQFNGGQNPRVRHGAHDARRAARPFGDFGRPARLAVGQRIENAAAFFDALLASDQGKANRAKR